MNADEKSSQMKNRDFLKVAFLEIWDGISQEGISGRALLNKVVELKVDILKIIFSRVVLIAIILEIICFICYHPVHSLAPPKSGCAKISILLSNFI